MPGHVYGACAQLADACVGARCALIGAWGSSKAPPARLYAIPSPHRFAFQSLAHVNDPRSYAAVARPHCLMDLYNNVGISFLAIIFVVFRAYPLD